MNKPYLKNWVDDLDLRCAESWEVGLFGSIFFIGHVAGSTFLAGYGDTIGRIPMIKLG